VQVTLIRATRFIRYVKDKKTTTFITSLQEIEKAIKDKQKDPQNAEELKEIRQQLPKIYQEYADMFSKQESDKLPDHKSYDHHIKLTGD
jgi:outer membrane protein assembly factor BamA